MVEKIAQWIKEMEKELTKKYQDFFENRTSYTDEEIKELVEKAIGKQFKKN
ncbi:hypothetical protein 15570_00002 [Lokiarchaeota virus WyrdV1]|nr:hypothetical protein 15570_00002 [Lokiarchaeota virus WyrdV1]